MRTRIIHVPKRNNGASEYFTYVCSGSRALRNTANFYIRNTMTGIQKSPEERTKNETEVLHYVFTGIQKANEAARAKKAQKFTSLCEQGGLAAHAEMKRFMKRCPTTFQYPTAYKWFLGYEVLDAIFKMTKNSVYYNMPSQANQNAIRKTVSAWKSYFNTLAAWKESPFKYRAKPRMPGYIHERETAAWFPNQAAKLRVVGKYLCVGFVNSDTLIRITKSGSIMSEKYIKTEVVPCYDGWNVCVTTDDGIVIGEPKDPTRLMGIDTGIDNLAAVATNTGMVPFLIKGRYIRSINREYNKERARLISELTKGKDSTHSVKNSHRLETLSRKRAWRMRDFFYKSAHYICRRAKEEKIEVIVIGHNKGQKDEIHMGKQTNQAFVSIPFTQFIQIVKTTAAKYGIFVKEREESYTSQASAIHKDPIPTYEVNDGTKHIFSGKRTKRGTYKTKDGIILNADVNAAANIIRKEYLNAFDGMQDLSYLWKTTRTVRYADLYKTKQAKQKAKTPSYRQSGHPSTVSRYNHRRRMSKKAELMEAFNAGKKVFRKQDNTETGAAQAA